MVQCDHIIWIMDVISRVEMTNKTHKIRCIMFEQFTSQSQMNINYTDMPQKVDI